MHNVLFVPGEKPRVVSALGLYQPNTRSGFKNPTNLAAAALSLGVNSAANLTWSHAFAAYVEGPYWGANDEGLPRNQVAEQMLNQLQRGVEFGTVDTQLYGPVLVSFDQASRYETIMSRVG